LCWFAESEVAKLLMTQSNSPTISLTAMQSQEGLQPGAVRVKAEQLLAYEQQRGFTRLRMLGAKSLDVREGTDEIDRLLRAAASSSRAGF
jgi:hypothetical protein